MRCWIENKVPQFWMSLRSNHCIAWRSYLPRSQQLWLDYIKYVETEDILRKHKHLYFVSGRSLFPELNEIVNEAGYKRMSMAQWLKKTNLQKLSSTDKERWPVWSKSSCWLNVCVNKTIRKSERWQWKTGEAVIYKIDTFSTVRNSHGDNRWWICWNRRERLNSYLLRFTLTGYWQECFDVHNTNT